MKHTSAPRRQAKLHRRPELCVARATSTILDASPRKAWEIIRVLLTVISDRRGPARRGRRRMEGQLSRLSSRGPSLSGRGWVKEIRGGGDTHKYIWGLRRSQVLATVWINRIHILHWTVNMSRLNSVWLRPRAKILTWSPVSPLLFRKL